jgi:hypothetical protein
MFTGIITGMGRIVAIHRLGSSSDHGKLSHHQKHLGYLEDAATALRSTALRRPPRWTRPTTGSPSTFPPNRWTRPAAWLKRASST